MFPSTAIALPCITHLIGVIVTVSNWQNLRPAKLLGVWAGTVMQMFSMRIPNAPSS